MRLGFINDLSEKIMEERNISPIEINLPAFSITKDEYKEEFRQNLSTHIRLGLESGDYRVKLFQQFELAAKSGNMSMDSYSRKNDLTKRMDFDSLMQTEISLQKGERVSKEKIDDMVFAKQFLPALIREDLKESSAEISRTTAARLISDKMKYLVLDASHLAILGVYSSSAGHLSQKSGDDALLKERDALIDRAAQTMEVLKKDFPIAYRRTKETLANMRDDDGALGFVISEIEAKREMPTIKPKIKTPRPS